MLMFISLLSRFSTLKSTHNIISFKVNSWYHDFHSILGITPSVFDVIVGLFSSSVIFTTIGTIGNESSTLLNFKV